MFVFIHMNQFLKSVQDLYEILSFLGYAAIARFQSCHTQIACTDRDRSKPISEYIIINVVA